MTVRSRLSWLRTTRLGTALMALAVALAFSAAPIYFSIKHLRDQRSQLATEAQRHLNSRIVLAQAMLERAKSVPGIIALTISQSGDSARFEGTVRNLLSMSGIVQSVNIVSTRDRAIVIERDAMDQAHPVAATFQSAGNLSLQNQPFTAFGDGSILIRDSLFETDSRGSRRFWGFLTVEASLAQLIQEMQLRALVNDGFGVKLSVQWPSSAKEVIIYSGGEFDGEGFSSSLPMPSRALLMLTLVPPAGGLAAMKMMAASVLAIASVLLFLLAYHLLRRPQQLARQVEERTREIVTEREALKKEIAARIQAESYLERSHALLDSIFEHIPGMVVLKRVSDMRVARINKSGERILGRPRDFILGRSDSELYSADVADFLGAADRTALQSQGLVRLPVCEISSPGEAPHWVEFSKTVLRDNDGEPRYILEFGEDLTEREILDRKLREHSHFLEQLIEAFPGPVFSKDTSGRYLAVNSSFEELIGRPRNDLIGKTVFDIAPENLAHDYDQADRALLAAGGKQIYESQVKAGDGGIVETMFHKAVFHSSDGETAGIVGIALDISARKNAERRVANLNRVLKVISEINHLIIHTRDRQTLLDQARIIIEEKGDFPAAWIRLNGENGQQFVADVKIHDFASRIAGEIDNPKRRCWPERQLHCHALDCCNKSLSEELAREGLQSLIHLPMRSGETDWGDIGILGAAGHVFTEEERALLEELAGNLSFALDTLRQDERRRSAENKLELSARVFESNSEGIIITDAENRILMVNRAFTAVTGYAADEVIGQTPALLNSGRHNAAFFEEMWQKLQRDGEWRGEVINRRKNGEEFPEWLSITQVRNERDEVSNYVAVFSDLTARRKIEARLDFLVHHDPLTSLPNRTHFSARLATMLEEAGREKERVAVVYFDLDRFKLVNESVGPLVGDELLIEVAGRLVAGTRNKLDVARLGGDQFAVMLSGLETSAQAAHFVQGIQQSLGRPFMQVAEQQIHLTSSIGISVFPDDGDDAETLTSNAESAMYRAIKDGGNTYRFFKQEMNEHAARRLRYESQLHHALERGELAVHFQPFVAATSGRIAGAEALLRWHCPELGGNVSPGIFIPLLEEIGLIREVGAWVLNQACAEVRRWREIAGDEIFVAVNISALQLNAELVQLVGQAIADHGISPAQLEIELTESAIMRDADQGIRILYELRALGVQLSIDDFGTGYSSLSYLKRLPMSTLKIDRSFVIDTPGDVEAVSITRAILALGNSLHLHIIAEGVETADQAAFLCQNGCDLLQGYYFSRPVPASDFMRLVEQGKVFTLPAGSRRSLQLMPGGLRRTGLV